MALALLTPKKLFCSLVTVSRHLLFVLFYGSLQRYLKELPITKDKGKKVIIGGR